MVAAASERRDVTFVPGWLLLRPEQVGHLRSSRRRRAARIRTRRIRGVLISSLLLVVAGLARKILLQVEDEFPLVIFCALTINLDARTGKRTGDAGQTAGVQGSVVRG